jgi:hypothetical protein
VVMGDIARAVLDHSQQPQQEEDKEHGHDHANNAIGSAVHEALGAQPGSLPSPRSAEGCPVGTAIPSQHHLAHHCRTGVGVATGGCAARVRYSPAAMEELRALPPPTAHSSPECWLPGWLPAQQEQLPFH